MIRLRCANKSSCAALFRNMTLYSSCAALTWSLTLAANSNFALATSASAATLASALARDSGTLGPVSAPALPISGS